MGVIAHLTEFYTAMLQDNRIGATHISTYMALFHLWQMNQFRNPVCFTRQQLMQTAKISGRATFHKCINDLQQFGYIKYVPSFNPAVKSQVYMNDKLVGI